jgi:hypothetical protein
MLNYLCENLKTFACISCFPWELLARSVNFVVSLEITEKNGMIFAGWRWKDAYNTWVHIPSHCRPLILRSVRQHQVDTEPSWNRVNKFHSRHWSCFWVFAPSGCGQFVGPAGIVVMVKLSNFVKNVPLLTSLFDRNRQQHPLFLPCVCWTKYFLILYFSIPLHDIFNIQFTFSILNATFLFFTSLT